MEKNEFISSGCCGHNHQRALKRLFALLLKFGLTVQRGVRWYRNVWVHISKFARKCVKIQNNYIMIVIEASVSMVEDS